MKFEHLVERIKNALDAKGIQYRTIRMFGGTCFMVDEKMCMGTYQIGLMARVGPQAIADMVIRPGAQQMIHGGREMKGYALVEEAALERDEELEFWIDKCLAFNPLAKSSKKKKKKK